METKQQRADRLYGLYEELNTLEAVGKREGLTRARVQQILAEGGYDGLTRGWEALRRTPEQKAATQRAYKKANKDKINAQRRNWRKRNPGKTAGYQREVYKRQKARGLHSWMRTYYGLAPAIKRAYPSCAICDTTEAGLGGDYLFTHQISDTKPPSLLNYVRLCRSCRMRMLETATCQIELTSEHIAKAQSGVVA